MLHRARELDAAVDADVAEMVRGERDLHPDRLAELADPVGKPGDALVGDGNPGERVHDPSAAAGVGPGRHRERARNVAQQVDPEILLQEGDAAVHPGFQHLALFLRRVPLRRVGVEADAIAELAAEHLPARHAPGLAGQIHHRHLDAAHAARLPRRRAELLDLPEDPVDVAGVLAEDAALQEERVGLAGAVADLAPSDEPLVGVDANQRAREGRAGDDGDAQVGDLERGRLGRAFHAGLDEIGRGVGRRPSVQGHRAGGAEAERLEEGTPIHGRAGVLEHEADGRLHRDFSFNACCRKNDRRSGGQEGRRYV